MCDKITTVLTIFFLSLSSSSFLSSIFSFKVWFSIFNCSKSIRWRPSASCSLFFRIFSLLASLFLSAIFYSLYWWTSWSFKDSDSSHSSKIFCGIFLPVLENTAFDATFFFNSLNYANISWHFAYFSFSFAWSSAAILLYLSYVSFKFIRTWWTLDSVFKYLFSFI